MGATLEIEFQPPCKRRTTSPTKGLRSTRVATHMAWGGWFRDRLDLVPENPLCPSIGRGSCNLAGSGEAWDEVSERSLFAAVRVQTGVRWSDWPCGQNPGRNPEGRQRAASARDDGASANRVLVAGSGLVRLGARSAIVPPPWRRPAQRSAPRQARRRDRRAPPRAPPARVRRRTDVDSWRARRGPPPADQTSCRGRRR